MGQEQSHGTGAAEGTSQTPSLFDRVKTSVVTPRLGRSDKIVVVSYGADTKPFDPTTDQHYIQVQQIPQFYPILRSLLNISSLKDPPDLYSKFSARAVSLLANRLNQHLALCAQQTGSEQQSLLGRIKEIDFILTSLGSHMTDRMKTYERFAACAQKIEDINISLKRVTQQLQCLVPECKDTNLLLPPELQLDVLDLSPICDEPLLNAMQRPLVLDSPDLELAGSTQANTPKHSFDITRELGVTEQTVVDE